MWALTITYYDGIYYAVSAYALSWSGKGDDLLSYKQPVDFVESDSWSDGIADPDLSWADDGRAYMNTSGVTQQIIFIFDEITIRSYQQCSGLLQIIRTRLSSSAFA